jgi:hypothetical protein
MIDLFKKTEKKDEQKNNGRHASAGSQMTAEDFSRFRDEVIETKAAVVTAIENMDKHNAIENLIKLSNLSAKAIYGKNLRAIVLVDDAIVDIKRNIDDKLQSVKDSNGSVSQGESEYYMLLRLSLIPVCSMLSVINTHTSTAIVEANEEIDDRIQELQRFLVEYETQISKIR